MIQSNLKPAIAFVLISLAALAGCSVSDDAEVYTVEGPIMGTQYHVKLVLEPDQKDSLATLEKGVEAQLKQVDSLMSTYKPDSEISRFNRQTQKDWFTISSQTYDVLKRSQAVSERTNGAFDVTVGPLVNLWGFGPEKRPDKVPSKRELNQIKKNVGYKLLELRADPMAIRKKTPGLYVDLSAIAKGYSVDRVADYLFTQGVDNFMIEVGGEIRIAGEKPGGDSWRLAIESPQENLRKVHRVLKISDVGMATSGDYRNYYELEGKRYAHTVDPRTGLTINHTLASVSVIDPSCAEADAMATAFMVMGTQQAMDYAVKHKIAAYFIDRVNGEFKTSYSPAFEKYLQQ